MQPRIEVDAHPSAYERMEASPPEARKGGSSALRVPSPAMEAVRPGRVAPTIRRGRAGVSRISTAERAP